MLAVIAGACRGGHAKPPVTTTAPTVPPVQFNQGGDITVAAQAEPGCMDWISTCAGSAWGVWTVETNTMPRAYDFTSDNLYKPSILLTGEADLVTGPAQSVTYHINPKAVWSDGQPITSHDFKYTWDQIAHGQSIYDQSGYRAIASVDDADPHTAVVTFTQSVADWKGLFGGRYGVLPSHLLEGQDRDALMKDGYSWSGGPWALATGGWVRSRSIKLVPNPNYWGKHPNLGSVTFDILTDPAAALQAYTSGSVQAVYPSPDPATLGYKALPDTYFDAVDGLDSEGLWLNTQSAPLSSRAVRQAIAFSLDRDVIANQLFGGFIQSVTAIQSFVTPASPKFYTAAFGRFRPDAAMVTQIMQGDGWAKGADGIWARAGKRAAITVMYAADNSRRQQTAALLQAQLKPFGFAATPAPQPAVPLFTHDLPAGAFAAALYSQDRRTESAELPPGGEPLDNSPRLCQMFCAANIPTAANGLTGANFARVNDASVDRYLAPLDGELNEDTRIDDVTRGMVILADLVPAIPIAAVPDVIVVNTKQLGVEGGTFNHNLAYGPFSYLNQWYLR